MRTLAAVVFAAAFGVLAAPAAAVVIGQVDTFNDGTTEGWFAGGGPVGGTHPNPPTVISSGGPGGTGDAYLQLTSRGGEVPGGRLVALNASQWAGNYLAAGVTGIQMDLRNFGSTDLLLRLYFEDPIPGPPVNEAITSLTVNLAAGADWTRVLFPITQADLIGLAGDISTVLSGTTVLRIFHGAAADFPGEPIVGLLGVDNIRAIGQVVPEPASIALLVAGAVMLGTARRTLRA